MMQVYTKTGDAGQTSMYTGERVQKCSPCIELLGLLDELQATLGVARAHATRVGIRHALEKVEADLVSMMAEVATSSKQARITERHVLEIEALIDSYSSELACDFELMIPGKTVAEAHLNLARTVCRRVERFACAHADEVAPNEQTMAYLNRLSDLLYVLARMETVECNTHQC